MLFGVMTSLDLIFHRPKGMTGLYIIWIGQMISGTASNITFFALPIWILNITGVSGSALGLWESFFFGSYLLFVLFAGALTDRYNRKMMMLVYDFLSLASTAVLLVLQTTGSLVIWHLYVAAIFQGIGFAFHSPSYLAAITTMVSKKEYIRANGLISLLDTAPEIFGPILAPILYHTIFLSGILGLNLLAFIISIGALLFVEVPPTPQTTAGRLSRSAFFEEVVFGIRYIFRYPGLLGIHLIFFFGNLFSGIALSVTALYTMIFLRTGNDPTAAGTVQSVAALAAVVAGIFLSTLGGMKKPVRAILLGWILSSVFGLIPLGSGQTLFIWLIAVIINSIFEPVVNVAIEAFLQTKIPPDLQGRVFSASNFITQAMIPIAPILAGLFGERIFEPAMAQGGALARNFGWLVGTGPGSGFGLLILICGVGGALVGLSGYLVSVIRNVDTLLIDYESTPILGTIKAITPEDLQKNAAKTKKPRKAKKLTGESRVKFAAESSDLPKPITKSDSPEDGQE